MPLNSRNTHGSARDRVANIPGAKYNCALQNISRSNNADNEAMMEGQQRKRHEFERRTVSEMGSQSRTISERVQPFIEKKYLLLKSQYV